MSIEIKQLLIKINVDDSSQSNATPDKKPGGKAENVIQTCIDEVMNIQNRKKER